MILGNLDVERELHRVAQPQNAYRQRKLPDAVADRISAAATLLRVYATEGERLWTPRPVAPARVVPVPGIAAVELISGEPPEGDVALRWGEVTEIAAAVNDRRFALALARERGTALPGAAVVASVDELEARIAALPAGAPWVAKAPWSASGRQRLRRRGALDDAARTRAARLLALFEALVFEPWVERVADAAVCGLVTGDDRVALDPPHALLVDRAGVFRAVDTRPRRVALDARERHELVASATAAGRALAAAGYRGPFGVDGYAYHNARGRRALQPMSEINARLGFGHVARAWAARLGGDLRLALGETPPPDATVVLAPGDTDLAAWVER